MRVAITGVSSFTGSCLAAAFATAGWETHALLARETNDYSGLSRERMRRLDRRVHWHPQIRAEDGSMAEWIRSHEFDLWVNHHHFMKDFRSRDYDIESSRAVSVRPVRELADALVARGVRGVIHSGTFFEAGEGGNGPAYVPTPYAVTKAEAWAEWERACGGNPLLLSKVVIPNPIGPHENSDRLIPMMMLKAFQHESLEVRSPQAVSDFLPGDDLARVYVRLADQILDGVSCIARPSGWIASVREFVSMTSSELLCGRLGLSAMRVVETVPPVEAPSFVNARDERVDVDWDHFWDGYAEQARAAGPEKYLRRLSV